MPYLALVNQGKARYVASKFSIWLHASDPRPGIVRPFIPPSSTVEIKPNGYLFKKKKPPSSHAGGGGMVGQDRYVLYRPHSSYQIAPDSSSTLVLYCTEEHLCIIRMTSIPSAGDGRAYFPFNNSGGSGAYLGQDFCP